MSELGPILIVEDEPNDVELTLAALEEYDLAKEVVVTRDGQEALDYLHRRGKFNTRPNGNPAIMLLDLNLPKVGGIEVLHQIKSDERLQMMPVVVLTSGTFGEDVGIEALKIGATDYILKTRLSRLASAVQNALREARERAEHNASGARSLSQDRTVLSRAGGHRTCRSESCEVSQYSGVGFIAPRDARRVRAGR